MRNTTWATFAQAIGWLEAMGANLAFCEGYFLVYRCRDHAAAKMLDFLC